MHSILHQFWQKVVQTAYWQFKLPLGSSDCQWAVWTALWQFKLPDLKNSAIDSILGAESIFFDLMQKFEDLKKYVGSLNCLKRQFTGISVHAHGICAEKLIWSHFRFQNKQGYKILKKLTKMLHVDQIIWNLLLWFL